MRRSLVWSLLGIMLLAVLSVGATIAAGHRPLLGLDLQGGVSVVLQPQTKVDTNKLQEAVTIIQRRVDGLGVANSNIQRQGNDVVINLPGIKDSQNALKVVGTTAELYFRPVLCAIPAFSPASTTTPSTAPTVTTPPSSPQGLGPAGGVLAGARLASASVPVAAGTPTTVPATPVTTAPVASTPGTSVPATVPATPAPGATAKVSSADCSSSNAAALPTTSPDNDNRTDSVIVPTAPGSGQGNIRYILGPADLTGQAVKTAAVALDSAGQYSVNLTFTGSGGKAFDKIAVVRHAFVSSSTTTSTDPRSQEAIELDGVLESAPTINSSSFNGQASISGSFTSSEASNLALELRYGSLPVRFTPQSVQTVSATIGKDSLHAGILAGLGGIIVVLIYMILYYRALGVVVLVGLGVGGAILYSILTELSQTSSLALTLSGVTGIIVSVGITVDSYVVYFERLKDEVRGGRSIRQSVERSFARAFRTVLTADLVSFMAALILYLFTVGDVKGFAFTLGLSTLLDVFTAYFFIRPAVILVGRRPALVEGRLLGVARGLGAPTAAAQA